jgi:predicted RNA-binding Zn-ribbon protein involved in translation (DUF1610 family)
MKPQITADVLAENITVTEGGHQTLDIEFDFLCSNCGRRHWARGEFCRHFGAILHFFRHGSA